MFSFPRILMAALLAVTMVAHADVSPAETVKGRIQSLAPDAQMLSLVPDTGETLYLSWTRGTAWKNLKSSADLSLDDVILVDYGTQAGQPTATVVTLLQPLVPAGMQTISVEDLAKQLGTSGPLPFTLIDTRPVERFVAGHLPGAVSVPLRKIERQSAGILPEDRNSPLIFSDGGAGDGSAARAAELVAKAGFTRVTLFPAGATGWVRSGRILACSPSYVRKGGAIIIDLRTPEKVAMGHIERAVSIPASKLAESYELFPKNKRERIIVYGENDAEALVAARTISGWGYRFVTYFPGGVNAWVASAEVLTTDPADDFIVSSTTSIWGALRGNDFELALLSSASVRIVDVRSAADHARGAFPNSVHIPLAQLAARLGELDRDMIQVVFGKDETEAEMAAGILRRKGYRVSYLQGEVEFQKGGKYLIK
jgi:rhodanese-related sulfurtransferase